MPAASWQPERRAGPSIAVPVQPAPGQISWEVVFCSSVVLASFGFYLMLFMPYLVHKVR